MRWENWTPRACMMLLFVATICVMLVGSVVLPVVTGEQIPPERSEAVKDITLVIVGGVLHWITEPVK